MPFYDHSSSFYGHTTASSYKVCAAKNFQQLRATERPHMNIKVQTAFEHSLKVLQSQFILTMYIFTKAHRFANLLIEFAIYQLFLLSSC